ncbi:hypothetical protein AAFF_G00254290 [Aldrovandia affinis]|uniref:Uncharacterized protein n=1 Tax=Aldrovandia affinis TaxID=143900 RepID=A0AAD7RCX0_9TELE|nr:hypothetical protein AAFF_G00254290 [Aldrovandia affinis]
MLFTALNKSAHRSASTGYTSQEAHSTDSKYFLELRKRQRRLVFAGRFGSGPRIAPPAWAPLHRVLEEKKTERTERDPTASPRGESLPWPMGREEVVCADENNVLYSLDCALTSAPCAKPRRQSATALRAHTGASSETGEKRAQEETSRALRDRVPPDSRVLFTALPRTA